jgi:hypothetical protein
LFGVFHVLKMRTDGAVNLFGVFTKQDSALFQREYLRPDRSLLSELSRRFALPINEIYLWNGLPVNNEITLIFGDVGQFGAACAIQVAQGRPGWSGVQGTRDEEALPTREDAASK